MFEPNISADPEKVEKSRDARKPGSGTFLFFAMTVPPQPRTIINLMAGFIFIPPLKEQAQPVRILPFIGARMAMSIQSRRDYVRYLREDMAAYDPNLRHWRPWHAIKYPTLAFQRKLRLAEWMINRARSPWGKAVGLIFRMRARSAGMRLGFSIPPNVFGPGLCIVHWGTIVVNDRARVGENCRLHPCTVIGIKNGGVPILGKNCYIGPGAKLAGAIELGDGVTIGANAVVTKSFPENVTLIGAPARVLDTKSDPRPISVA